MVKISIIIPVYNVENYLKQCLESLIKQTFKDLEIICINDGSTDNSLAILEKYAQKDNRIRIITQKNQGQGVARNKGIELATGEYIGFIDPDDWINHNMYEILYKKALETDCDYVMCDFYRYFQVNNSEEYVSISKRLKGFGFELNNNHCFQYEDIKPVCFRKMYNYTWNKIYKSDFIKKNKIKFAEYRKSEDNIFSIKVKILGKGFYLSEALYYYRIHDLSTCKKIPAPLDTLNNDIKILLLNLSVYDELKPYYDEYVASNYYNGITLIDDKKYQKEYEKKYKRYLEKEQYKLFRKDYNLLKQKKFISNIFSVKNKYVNAKKHKIVSILGIKFSI